MHGAIGVNKCAFYNITYWKPQKPHQPPPIQLTEQQNAMQKKSLFAGQFNMTVFSKLNSFAAIRLNWIFSAPTNKNVKRALTSTKKKNIANEILKTKKSKRDRRPNKNWTSNTKYQNLSGRPYVCDALSVSCLTSNSAAFHSSSVNSCFTTHAKLIERFQHCIQKC